MVYSYFLNLPPIKKDLLFHIMLGKFLARLRSLEKFRTRLEGVNEKIKKLKTLIRRKKRERRFEVKMHDRIGSKIGFSESNNMNIEVNPK